ncbi:MAG: ribonuclease D [Dehalococcoidia bacterium]
MTQISPTYETVFIDTQPRLDVAVQAISRSPIVGFDTEFVGESTYQPQLCLIQIATADQIFVIDPLSRVNLHDFWQALTDPSREVVALAARQELLFCLRFAGRLPGTVFDPQLAAGLVGFSYPLSHTNLVQRALNTRVEGGESYTDWRKRPLTGKQLGYAADDVRYLLRLRQMLLDRAAEMGRVEWLRSECEKSAQRVAESESEDRWWRVSGASGVDRRGLAVLREVWKWRDDTARESDVPPRRVLGDDLLMAVVKRKPKSVPDLFALRGFDRPNLRKGGDEIVEAVKRGLNVPEADLPELMRRDDPAQVQILGSLASILANSLASEHQVDIALLATVADLQEVVRWRLGLTDEAPPQLLEGWRGEILGQPLIELLDGKRVVRVADLHSPKPLVIEDR